MTDPTVVGKKINKDMVQIVVPYVLLLAAQLIGIAASYSCVRLNAVYTYAWTVHHT
jgi:hypothetical protein